MSILNNEIERLDSYDFIIKEWLEKYCKIEGSYYIKNNEIYIDGSVEIMITNITNFPYKFKIVTGKFNCDFCRNLITLENCPDEVNDFSCVCCTSLTNLIGSPKRINHNCHFENDINLRSLEGAPEYIGGIIINSGTGISYRDWETYKYYHCPDYREFHLISNVDTSESVTRLRKDLFDKEIKAIKKRGEVYFCCDHI